jgi:hypothetical protein
VNRYQDVKPNEGFDLDSYDFTEYASAVKICQAPIADTNLENE